MRTTTVVTAAKRDTRGKNAARRVRMSGKIPATIFGAFIDPIAIEVDPKAIRQILHSRGGHNTIFNIDVEGVENTPVMVVDEQYDPIKSHLLHVDLKRIDLAKKIRVAVPVVTHGEAKGIKLQGGLLEIVTRSVEIECVPDSIPDQYVVDVSELMIGGSKRASDIQLADGVRLVSPGDAVIAHVVGLKAAEEPVAAAVAEPEVAAKKGKKEDEAAPPAADKGKKK